MLYETPVHKDSEPTVLPFIVLSDLVIREHGTGKISMIGTFELFNAPSFPFQCPPFFATVGVTNIQLKRSAGEPPQEVNFNVRVEDPHSGHVYGNATGKVGILEGKTLLRNAIIPLPLPLPSMTFDKPGTVKVVLLVDNERLADRDLQINSISAISPQ